MYILFYFYFYSLFFFSIIHLCKQFSNYELPKQRKFQLIKIADNFEHLGNDFLR